MFPQAAHFLSEISDLFVMFSGVFTLGKEAQVRQPVIVLVCVDVVDFFVWAEATSNAFGDNEAVFIHPPPFVRHWQERAVERYHHLPIPTGRHMASTLPPWVLFAAGPTLRLARNTMLGTARVTAKAYRLPAAQLHSADLAAVQTGSFFVSRHVDILPHAA